MRRTVPQFELRSQLLAAVGTLAGLLASLAVASGGESSAGDFAYYEVWPLPAVNEVAFAEEALERSPSDRRPEDFEPLEPLLEPPFPASQLPPLGLAPMEIDAGLAGEDRGHPRPKGILPFAPAWGEDCDWNIAGLARGYWLNDQRIEWTGVESTLGAEGSLAPSLRRQYGDWELLAYGDFYFNQPFDRNILLDTAERRSYRANFEVEPFEISNLYLSATHGDFTITLGKFETPFGRYYFPLMSNPRFDAPFLRTEAIDWRETGLLAHYQRGLLVADVAVTNGTEHLDTNSSKALVARLGIEGSNFAAGCSVKTQDGIGSEWQKVYESHVGADAMLRFGRWTLSGEVIYDEYGFRRPGYGQNSIFWGRSIYNRDIHNPSGQPLSSVAYYVDLGFQGERWYWGFNYGVNDPVAVGNALHDQTIHRGIVKTVYSLAPGFDALAVLLLENGGFPAQANRDRSGELVYVGMQATF